MEQRYHAVMEVVAGRVPVTEVADRYGVSRQSVHTWVRRYRESGLAGLTDRSHRPAHQPRQLGAEVEALVCELRRAHPRWGPRRLLFELARAGVDPVPSRSTVYRVLVRHGLVAARPRRRRREDYTRWQREAPMQLWQLDVMGSVFLADGREAKLVSGIDDHSRFCVIAAVVPRATARAVCAAFVAALAEFGCPEQVLTDNGKQFTGKYGRPRPSEVLFDRICRHNGIEHLLTKIRSPTTTGKVERWHQSIQDELLAAHASFVSVAAAQAAVDAWRAEYNHTRPHQALDMAAPATRFAPVPAEAREALPLWVPGELHPLHAGDPAPAAPGQDTDDTDAEPAPAVNMVAEPPRVDLGEPAAGEAVEVDRVAPVCGNLAVGPQQFWLGRSRAGKAVRLWIDTRTVHVSLDGAHYKTLPSRFSSVDLARLRADGAHPAGPPPDRPSAAGLAATATLETERLVNGCGLVSLAGQILPIGMPLAGRMVTLRVEQHLVHVITDGQVWKTIPHTIPPAKRARIRGAHLPAPRPIPATEPVRVQRRVSSRGGIQVVSQPVHVGYPHRHTIVTVEVDETVLRVLDEHDTLIKVVPRTSQKEVTRYKAYSAQQRAQA